MNPVALGKYLSVSLDFFRINVSNWVLGSNQSKMQYASHIYSFAEG